MILNNKLIEIDFFGFLNFTILDLYFKNIILNKNIYNI